MMTNKATNSDAPTRELSKFECLPREILRDIFEHVASMIADERTLDDIVNEKRNMSPRTEGAVPHQDGSGFAPVAAPTLKPHVPRTCRRATRANFAIDRQEKCDKRLLDLVRPIWPQDRSQMRYLLTLSKSLSPFVNQSILKDVSVRHERSLAFIRSGVGSHVIRLHLCESGKRFETFAAILNSCPNLVHLSICGDFLPYDLVAGVPRLEPLKNLKTLLINDGEDAWTYRRYMGSARAFNEALPADLGLLADMGTTSASYTRFLEDVFVDRDVRQFTIHAGDDPSYMPKRTVSLRIQLDGMPTRDTYHFDTRNRRYIRTCYPIDLQRYSELLRSVAFEIVGVPGSLPRLREVRVQSVHVGDYEGLEALRLACNSRNGVESIDLVVEELVALECLRHLECWPAEVRSGTAPSGYSEPFLETADER